MSPEEIALYQLTAFDIGDIVEIDDSEVIGIVDGFAVTINGEDEYLIRYHDNCGNPQRQWWPASCLSDADDEEQSNVIQFPVGRTSRPTVH
jgi:hypothetical protein